MLESMDLPGRERDVLAAILIVEASQRPEWVQKAEWLVLRLGGRIGLPKRLLPRTLGPFQMTDAPGVFRDAVEAARQRLDGHMASLEDVATVWYGSPNRTRGSAISYVDALAHASALWFEVRRENRGRR
jgi:hypothetical protein